MLGFQGDPARKRILKIRSELFFFCFFNCSLCFYWVGYRVKRAHIKLPDTSWNWRSGLDMKLLNFNSPNIMWLLCVWGTSGKWHCYVLLFKSSLCHKTSVSAGKKRPSPSIPGAMKAAMIAAHLAVNTARFASLLVHHGQLSRWGVSWCSLSGRPSRFADDGGIGVPEKRLSKIRLLEDLTAFIDSSAEKRNKIIQFRHSTALPNPQCMT